MLILATWYHRTINIAFHIWNQIQLYVDNPFTVYLLTSGRKDIEYRLPNHFHLSSEWTVFVSSDDSDFYLWPVIGCDRLDTKMDVRYRYEKLNSHTSLAVDAELMCRVNLSHDVIHTYSSVMSCNTEQGIWRGQLPNCTGTIAPWDIYNIHLIASLKLQEFIYL